MRILRLDLLAFGHFTGVSLDLSAGPGTVQLIYGANEAGKSTALRALRALFYGIDARSPDSFRHEYHRLKLGALVQRADGVALEFVRRKGNRNTFLDREGNPADDAPLRAALSAVDGELFSALFGLNHERLVAGGQSLLRAGGEVGESLFSAGAGGVNLRAVLERLEGEAAELFKPQGQNQPINQACRSYGAARQQVAEHSLPSQKYLDHVENRKKLLEAREQAAAERDRLRRETHRLERIQRALPLLPKRRVLLDVLASVGPVPELPRDFSQQRVAAETALSTGRQQHRSGEEQLADLDARIASLLVPAALLARDQVITNLYQRLDGHLKSVAELPVLRGGLRAPAEKAARLRAELGLAETAAPTLSRGAQQKIQALAGRHPLLFEQAASAGRTARELADELRARQDERATLPDIAALHAVVHDVQRHGNLEETLATHQSTLRAGEAAAAEDLRRLDLWRGTLDELAALALPSAETIDRYDAAWLAAGEALAQTRAQQKKLGERLRQCEHETAAMLRAGSVPSEAELAAARARRETSWQVVRHAWLEDGAVPSAALAATHEEAVLHADTLADRLRREAARVAQHAALAVEADSLAAEARLLADQSAEQHAAWDRLQAEWRGRWLALVEPLPPREMRAWLQKQERLVEQADRLRELRWFIATVGQRIAESRIALAAHLPGTEAQALHAILSQGERIVARAELLDRDIGKLLGGVRAAESEKTRTAEALADWRGEWHAAMREIGRGEATGPEEAYGFIQGCHELQEQLEQSVRMQTRIEMIDLEAKRFETEAAAVFGQLDPERACPPAEEAVGELYVRLGEAKQAAATRAVLKKQRADTTENSRRARAVVLEAETILKNLCAQAGCMEAAQLAETEQRAADAAGWRGDLRQIHELLAAESAGTPLEDFIAAVEGCNGDQLEAENSETGRRLAEQEALHTQLSTEIGRLDRDIQEMDGNARAVEAAEEAQSILARLEEHTERYVRLKLAAVILRREIEDYRVKNQSPLLARGSEFFRRLTLGSFTGVTTDFDDNDNPVLEGVRAGGERVRVEGFSDGTRDQLFLALKLAAVERFVADCEPMPLVADDVLMTFDHERERAVFEVLGEVARRTQVIVFTHHRHQVDLAKEVLGDAVRVHDLGAWKNAGANGGH